MQLTQVAYLTKPLPPSPAQRREGLKIQQVSLPEIMLVCKAKIKTLHLTSQGNWVSLLNFNFQCRHIVHYQLLCNMGKTWITHLKTTVTSGLFVFVYIYITKFSQVPLSIHQLQFSHATSSSSCKIAESAFFRSTVAGVNYLSGSGMVARSSNLVFNVGYVKIKETCDLHAF